MRVTVTGGSGFIGRRVVHALRAQHQRHDVAVLDRHENLSILSKEDCARAIDGADVVIHLAGMLGTAELLDTIPAAVETNIIGTNNVLRAALATKARYVGITMPDCWPSVYQATKLAAQRIAEAYSNSRGLSVTHLRVYNVYGPGQAYGPGHPQKILPTFASAVWRDEPIPIWGDGTQTVDLVHVDDVAGAFLKLVEGDYRDPVYECGTARETEVIQVARDIAAAAKAPSFQVRYLPMRAGELEHTKLAARKGHTLFQGLHHGTDPVRFREAVEFYRSDV